MAGSHVPKRHHHHLGAGKHKHLKPSSNRGPTGKNDAAHPGFGPCLGGDTCGPVGHGGDYADPNAGKAKLHKKKTPILILDSKKVHALIRSVAYAKAQQMKVKLRWKEDESKFMQGLYTVMFWKGRPGTVEVDTGDWKAIDKIAAADTEHMLSVMMAKAGQGPQKLTEYLKGLEEIRNYALDAIRDVYKEAGELNREIRECAAEGIKRLAVIKFGADLLVAALGSVAKGPLAIVIPILYHCGLDVIKNMDDAPSAHLIAFTGVAAEKTSHHVLHHKAEHFTEKMAEAQEEQELQAELSHEEASLFRKLISDQKKMLREGKITGKQAQKLYKQIGREARRGYGMQISAEAAEEQALRLSRLKMMGKAAGGAIQIVFFAWQAKESWEELNETFEQAEQGVD